MESPGIFVGKFCMNPVSYPYKSIIFVKIEICYISILVILVLIFQTIQGALCWNLDDNHFFIF